jgi:serine/threonine protein kinase
MASVTPPAATDISAPVVTGRRLGKYEILRHIATGGMAEIHLARATGIEGFEKLCVIKQILPNLAENREFVDMFLDEARLAATLHHSNVVQVYDIGSVAGVFFFSMEFLHGEDVSRINKAVVARGEKFPLDHAMSIAIGACAGLHYAHEKTGMDGRALNIVHRDVSPANVFVTFDGGIKLLDFGIAKASLRQTQTRVGTLKGKIRYMSPEQCRGAEIDRRSDVFSLCIMLWELTTGARLFSGDTEFELMECIVNQDARPASRARPGYPPELERILAKGLARNPAQRYQTAEDLQIDLENFARETKLVISTVALSRWVRGLFVEKLAAWQRAQQEGKAFSDFLADAYSQGHESGSGSRASGGRRTRTETSGEPLQNPTVAGSPSALLQMMAGVGVAAPAPPPPEPREQLPSQEIRFDPSQEVRIDEPPVAASPDAAPSPFDEVVDAAETVTELEPDEEAAPDETVHDAYVGAPTVAAVPFQPIVPTAPYSQIPAAPYAGGPTAPTAPYAVPGVTAAPYTTSDSVDAPPNEFDEERARTTQTPSNYVGLPLTSYAPPPAPPAPRLRLGVIAAVAVAFVVPAVAIVLFTSRDAAPPPQIQLPVGLPASAAPADAAPTGAALEKPAPASAPAVAPAAERPTAADAAPARVVEPEVVPEKPFVEKPFVEKPLVEKPLAEKPLVEKPKPERKPPKPAVRPDREKPAPAAKPAPKPKVKPKKGSDLDSLLPP